MTTTAGMVGTCWYRSAAGDTVAMHCRLDPEDRWRWYAGARATRVSGATFADAQDHAERQWGGRSGFDVSWR